MQGKQAEAVLSDLVMKCEETGVALPSDPWDALDAVLAAIKSVKKHEMGRMQMDEALSRLMGKFGTTSTTGARKKRAAGGKAVEDEGAVISPKAKRSKAAAAAPKPATVKQEQKKKNVPIQEQVRAEPAARKENQALVDQFVELGDFEMHSGHTQRGLARMRAAKQLRDTDMVITSGAQAKQLDHVGPSAAAKIDAILSGGLEGALREYSGKM